MNSAIPSSSATWLDDISLQESTEIMLLLNLQQIITIISDTLILSSLEKKDQDLAIQAVLNHRSTQLITLTHSLAMHIGLSASLIATIVQDINWLLKKEIRNEVQHILVFSVQESDSKLIEAIMARAELSVIMHLHTLGKAEGAPCLQTHRSS